MSNKKLKLQSLIKKNEKKKNIIYVLITARKNSKELKNKNLLKLGGISLTKRTIKNFENINFIKKIFLSSDSKKILNEAEKKITKILRPKKYANDNSKSEEVVFHFLNWLKKNGINHPDFLFIAQPTSPFVTKKNITLAKKMIIKKNASSIVSVIKTPHKYNILNQRKLEEDGKIKFYYKKERELKYNRQLKKDSFSHGNLFLIKISEFKKQKKILCEPIYALKLSSFKESIDIDNKIDLLIARFFLKN